MRLLVINLYNLGNAAKTSRWDLVGSYYYGLHKLLDELDVWARKQGDVIAERMILLGEKPSVLPEALIADNFTEPSPPATYGHELIVRFIIDNLKGLYEYCELLGRENGHCENYLFKDLQREIDEHIVKFNKIIQ